MSCFSHLSIVLAVKIILRTTQDDDVNDLLKDKERGPPVVVGGAISPVESFRSLCQIYELMTNKERSLLFYLL